MILVGKTVHVGPCLGNNDFGNTPVDSGGVIQSIDDFLLFAESSLDVVIQFGSLTAKKAMPAGNSSR